MTTITILPDNPELPTGPYRAIAGDKQTIGKTAGEALDAITNQLPLSDTVTLVILQRFHPDPFFPAQQQQRLGELMGRWRQARSAGGTLSAEELAELNTLVETETRAAAARAAALANGLAP